MNTVVRGDYRNRPPPSPDNYPPHELDAAERDMQVVLDSYVALTPDGFYVSPRPMAIPRSVEWLGPAAAVISRDNETFAFWQSRMAMRTEEALAALIACRAWLRANAVNRKSLDKEFNSEKLRNIAALHIGAISHGVVIAALDLERFTVRQAIDSIGQPTPNAWTNAHLPVAAYRFGGKQPG